MKNILLIITGSIASYKAADLVRICKKKSYNVTCVLTPSAQKFVTPLLISSISGNKCYTELFEDNDKEMSHISLSRAADAIIIAPATANFLAKIANGVADDLASSIILASDKKFFFAPAMNEKMLFNQNTQENINKILNNGNYLIDVTTDILACLEYGEGKMASVETIFEKIENYLTYKDSLKGVNITITGGATYEPIDPVRFIGNYSSGKQSIYIARKLFEAGANVKFITSNINHQINLPNVIKVRNSDEMYLAVKDNLNCDIFIGCAAVSDYKIKNYSNNKIKKNKEEKFILELERTVDILDFVGNNKKRPKIVIGFAAEGENIENYAKDKLIKKNCDFIIANDIKNGQIFNSEISNALIIKKDSIKSLGEVTKKDVAENIYKEIIEILKNT